MNLFYITFFKDSNSLNLWSEGIFNFIDVLCVILPMLLGVAFMTIIERKQLAAHQRRVGPNAVGWGQKKKFKDLKHTKRFIHNFNSINLNSNIDYIKNLYHNRLAPVKSFDSNIIDTCLNITSSKELSFFFNKFKDKGGIYLIQYKEDLNIYYIGRAKNFKKRVSRHLKTKVKDKFHLFATLVGWDKFNFSIIEICDLKLQQDRENFYLKTYLPLLNTVFKSNFSDSQIYDTLYSKLKAKQNNLDYKNKHIGISLFVYTYDNEQINQNFLKFDSINNFSKEIHVSP